jgi:hypothetical protein
VSAGEGEAARADLGRRLLAAARGSGEELKPLVHDGAEEVLRALVANPALEEDDLLMLLRRHDLSPEVLRQVAGDATRTNSYAVRLALVRHPRTPASAGLKFVPHLHLFDLVAVSLIPHLPREVKASAEGSILGQLKQLPLGVRITLGRRTGSDVVLGRLLADREASVVEAALTNARLTEGIVVRAVRDATTPPHAIDLISRNGRWSVRHDVRYSLVRNRYTPLGRALQFLQSMSQRELRDLSRDSGVPPQLRSYLTRMAK